MTAHPRRDEARASACAHLAETDYRRGRYLEAREGYQRSLDIALAAHLDEAAVAAQIGLARARWSLAEAGARELLEQCLQCGFLRQEAWAHNSLGEIDRSQRHFESARHHFSIAESIFARLSDSGPLAILKQNLAFVELAQGQAQAAAPRLRAAFEHWFRCGSQHGLAISLIGLALLALQLQERSTAESLAVLAERLLEELNCPLDLSDRLEREALMRLLGTLSSPAEIQVDEELVGLVKRLTQPQPVPTETTSSSGASENPLTSREREVLQLLARGLSNLAIAEQLVISRHTVTVHLRTIYDKLGVHSRSAATRWALENGLG